MLDIGKQLAEDFVKSGQDIFVMATEIEGRDVTVTVKFAPPAIKMTSGDVWNIFAQRIQRNANQSLT